MPYTLKRLEDVVTLYLDITDRIDRSDVPCFVFLFFVVSNTCQWL